MCFTLWAISKLFSRKNSKFAQKLRESLDHIYVKSFFLFRHTGENKITNRDTLLAIFSDARVAAPVIQTASLHSEAKEPNRAYLYVFKHVTKKGYYPEVSWISYLTDF